MSRENVEVAREGVARFTEGDMDGLAELYTPDAVIVAPEGWPEGGRFEGRDAVIRQFARIQEEWGRQAVRVEDERSGDEWVVLKFVWSAQGKASGAPLEMKIFGAYRVKDRKIEEARFFWDFDEALEAVGLRE